MDEKTVIEIALMIVRGKDPNKIHAYHAASLRDRNRIDAKVDEFRRRAASEAEKNEERELQKRERALDESSQPKF